MSKWAALGGSNTVIVLSAAALAVAAIGAGFYINSRTGVAPETVNQASIPTPEPEISSDSEASAEAETEIESADATPSIDEVRVEADGLTIVAGRASPGSEISVLLDGVENTSVTADAGGGFAAITMVEPKTTAQVLTVVQSLAGNTVSSQDEIILAPSSASQKVVEALPEVGSEVGERPDASAAVVAPQEPEAIASIAPEVESVAKPDVAETAPVSRQSDENETDQTFASNAQDPSGHETIVTVNDDKQAITADRSQTTDVSNEIAQSSGADEVVPGSSVVAQVSEDSADTPQAVEAEEDAAPETQDQNVGASVVTSGATIAQEPQQLTVLKSTSEGVEVLAPRLRASDTVAIDAISYSVAGEVQLSGRAKPDAKIVRVYVNNRPVTELDVDAQGRWRGDLPEVDTGVYTLRVDEVNEDGAVMSRVETPFKREDPQFLIGTDPDTRTTRQITVQTGATLWAIARDRYGEGLLYVHVYEANRETIVDPDLIYPGQVFALPD